MHPTVQISQALQALRENGNIHGNDFGSYIRIFAEFFKDDIGFLNQIGCLLQKIEINYDRGCLNIYFKQYINGLISGHIYAVAPYPSRKYKVHLPCKGDNFGDDFDCDCDSLAEAIQIALERLEKRFSYQIPQEEKNKYRRFLEEEKNAITSSHRSSR